MNRASAKRALQDLPAAPLSWPKAPAPATRRPSRSADVLLALPQISALGSSTAVFSNLGRSDGGPSLGHHIIAPPSLRHPSVTSTHHHLGTHAPLACTCSSHPCSWPPIPKPWTVSVSAAASPQPACPRLPTLAATSSLAHASALQAHLSTHSSLHGLHLTSLASSRCSYGAPRTPSRPLWARRCHGD